MKIKITITTVVIVGIIDILASLGLFGVQAYQINRLDAQQQQITTSNSKSNCWDHVLDNAVNRKVTRAALTREAIICSRIK